MSRDPRKTFWFRVARNVDNPPIPGQCHYVYPDGRSRCGQALSEKHGDGKWCWAHRGVRPDGRRCTGPRGTPEKQTMDAKAEIKLQYRVRKIQNERVLRHLTDAAHAVSPCPDDSSVRPDYVELASGFRAERKRWPLWWEMAKAIQEDGTRGDRGG